MKRKARNPRMMGPGRMAPPPPDPNADLPPWLQGGGGAPPISAPRFAKGGLTLAKKEAADKKADKRAGQKESKAEEEEDKKQGFAKGGIKLSGSFAGKSNKLGYGGRAAQLEAKGVPGGVIGNLARKAGAAPGGPNYHGGAKKKAKKGT